MYLFSYLFWNAPLEIPQCGHYLEKWAKLTEFYGLDQYFSQDVPVLDLTDTGSEIKTTITLVYAQKSPSVEHPNSPPSSVCVHVHVCERAPSNYKYHERDMPTNLKIYRK